MRAKILFITLISMAFFTHNANGADFRAVYDFEYTKDSINSIIEKILFQKVCLSECPKKGPVHLDKSREVCSFR